MKLSEHPFGRPYLHVPTGKVIYLSQSYSGGLWLAHYQYREQMIVREEDLDFPLTSDIVKHYPAYK